MDSVMSIRQMHPRVIKDVRTRSGQDFSWQVVRATGSAQSFDQGAARTPDILWSGDAWQIRLGADTESCNNGVLV